MTAQTTQVSPLKDADDVEARKTFITDVLKARLGLTVTSIDIPDRTGNNFIHIVHVEPPSSPSSALQPGTVPVPLSTTKLIMRIARPAAGSDVSVYRKIENEVAAMELAHGAVGHYVPEVYAWSGIEEENVGDERYGCAWVVMEFKPGSQMFGTKIWENFTVDQRIQFVRNFAPIYRKLRTIPFPGTTPTPYGGIGYATTGEITTKPYILGSGGPYATPQDSWRALFLSQLKLSDGNEWTKGWKEHGLRERIDKFVADPNGLEKALNCVAGPPTFLHGDLGTMNILTDVETLQPTAVIDFEWSGFAPPAEEFFMSLADFGFLFDDEEGPLRRALAEGFPPPAEEGEDDKYKVAWALDDAVKRLDEEAGVVSYGRTCTVPHMKDSAILYWFTQYLSQWYYSVPTFWERKAKDEGGVEGELEKTRKSMRESLEYFGF